MSLTFGQVSRYTEEKEPPKIRISGVRPGGIVDIETPTAPDLTKVRMPLKAIVIFAPHVETPRGPEVTPEALQAGGYPSIGVDIPETGGPVVAVVPGVVPGEYDVQLLLEWAD